MTVCLRTSQFVVRNVHNCSLPKKLTAHLKIATDFLVVVVVVFKIFRVVIEPIPRIAILGDKHKNIDMSLVQRGLILPRWGPAISDLVVKAHFGTLVDFSTCLDAHRRKYFYEVKLHISDFDVTKGVRAGSNDDAFDVVGVGAIRDRNREDWAKDFLKFVQVTGELNMLIVGHSCCLLEKSGKLVGVLWFVQVCSEVCQKL